MGCEDIWDKHGCVAYKAPLFGDTITIWLAHVDTWELLAKAVSRAKHVNLILFIVRGRLDYIVDQISGIIKNSAMQTWKLVMFGRLIPKSNLNDIELHIPSDLSGQIDNILAKTGDNDRVSFRDRADWIKECGGIGNVMFPDRLDEPTEPGFYGSWQM